MGVGVDILCEDNSNSSFLYEFVRTLQEQERCGCVSFAATHTAMTYFTDPIVRVHPAAALMVRVHPAAPIEGAPPAAPIVRVHLQDTHSQYPGTFRRHHSNRHHK